MAALLRVDGLRIVFPGSAASGPAVDGVSFDLAAGESLAIVGESGSGKTLIGKSLLGLLPDAARVQGGSVLYRGRELLGQNARQWREIRGTGIGMVFQEPMVSLNPAFRIGEQLTEALLLRRSSSHGEDVAQREEGRAYTRSEAWEAAVAMLERVRVRNARDCMRRYPHEFSGGMRQRILLAGVMLLRPRLLIADEPTTALDCIVQKEVLDLMFELVREQGTALIFISHNLALVAAYTQRVLVMCRGRSVESGATRQILSRPADDYTLNLLEALPRRGPARAAAHAEPVLSVRGLAVDYPVGGGWLRRRKARAVHGVDLSVAPGETLAVVGESGSGKTTVMMALLGLVPHARGEIMLGGRRLHNGDRQAWQTARRRIQMIFQDPYSSLDPRMRIEALVGEGLRRDAALGPAQRRERVAKVLADVGLGPQYAQRYVHELSGGQRQRVAIARALVLRPELVIADEPVSALDVTVQKQVLETLVALQWEYRYACLFVSHDLGVVEQLADRVAVMLHGHVVEEGTRDEVFDRPAHPYTRRLLQAVPELRGSREQGFRVETRRLAEHAGRLPDRSYFVPGADGLAMPRMAVVAESGPSHRVALSAA